MNLWHVAAESVDAGKNATKMVQKRIEAAGRLRKKLSLGNDELIIWFIQIFARRVTDFVNIDVVRFLKIWRQFLMEFSAQKKQRIIFLICLQHIQISRFALSRRTVCIEMKRAVIVLIANSLPLIHRTICNEPCHLSPNINLMQLSKYRYINRLLSNLEPRVINNQSNNIVIHRQSISHTVVNKSKNRVGLGGNKNVDGDVCVDRGEGDGRKGGI